MLIDSLFGDQSFVTARRKTCRCVVYGNKRQYILQTCVGWEKVVSVFIQNTLNRFQLSNLGHKTVADPATG